MITLFLSAKSRIFSATFKLAEELEQKLSWVPGCTNGMDKIVEFFQTTSPYYDKVLQLLEGRSKDPQFGNERKQKLFTGFSKFLHNTGRSDYGWNRTKIGESPSATTVYINMKVPYDELFNTRSVYEHLSRRNNPKGEVDYALKENRLGKWNETGLIESEFVNPFMKKNYEFLRAILKEFRAS